MSVFTGVDVSKWQGNIDFDQLATAVSFVIYKGTGWNTATGQLEVDPDFSTNNAQAASHNMYRGIYHYGGGTDAVTEANYFASNCLTDLDTGVVVMLDAEYGNALSPAWCLTFLQTLEGLLGFKPMIYMNHNLMMSADWSPVSGANYGLWLADWNGDPNVVVTMHDWTFCAIQQYSDTGSIAGISGNVDVDAFFASNMNVWSEYGKPAPVPVVTPPAAPVVVNDPLPPTPVVTPPNSTPSLPTSTTPTTKTAPTFLDDVEKGISMSKYNKFIVALVGMVITWLTLHYDTSQVVQDVVMLATALGVYQVKND